MYFFPNLRNGYCELRMSIPTLSNLDLECRSYILAQVGPNVLIPNVYAFFIHLSGRFLRCGIGSAFRFDDPVYVYLFLLHRTYVNDRY